MTGVTMKVVIQCAGQKRKEAGKLRSPSGEEIPFVASPTLSNDRLSFRCHLVLREFGLLEGALLTTDQGTPTG